MKKPNESVVFKSVSGIVVLLVVFSAIISYIGYKGFTETLLEQYSDGALLIANSAALSVNADKMENYKNSGGKTTEYNEVWGSLDRLCNSSGSTFIYVIQPDISDYAHITFLFSTINRNSHYNVYDFGYVRETTNDDYRQKYRKLYEGTSDHEIVIRDKGYIETDAHITALISLKGSDGQTKAILCVQRQMENLITSRRSYVRRVIFVLVFIALIVVIGQCFYLYRVFLRPIQKITNEAGRFADENITTGTKLTDTIHNKDEIGVLAGSIDKMEDQIVSYVDNLTRVTAEKERISTELALATQIQASMLPNIFPPYPDRTDFSIFASMTPAKEVGGDFYDFFLIDNDHLGMIIADVSGKGIPAALFMMSSKILLENLAIGGLEPAEVLTKANIQLCKDNETNMFVTVWYGIMEISTGIVKAANAGHEYPIIKGKDGIFKLFKDKHCFVLGEMEEIRYTQYKFEIGHGETLFLYTDGVPEAANIKGEMFSTDRLLKALNTKPDDDPRSLLENVSAHVNSFVDNAEQFDDLTMLCVKRI